MTTFTTNTSLRRRASRPHDSVDPAKLIGSLIFAQGLSLSALAGVQTDARPGVAPSALSQGEVWRGNSARLPGDR